MTAVLVVVAASMLSPVTAARAPDPVESARVSETVSAVAALVEREYFDAAVASRVAGTLRERLKSGRYEAARSPETLATLLTNDLRELTSDLHLAVTVVARPAADATPATAVEHRALDGRRSNFGVQRAEILPANVGYLALTGFYRLDEARAALEAAMAFLQHADALVLDLRANGGGSPDTVAFVASYLVVPAGHPLFEIVPRSGEPGRYEVSPIPGQGRDTTRPVYVLTSRATFSAGEGLAFLLQAANRAEVVGERTAGAANPGRPYRVNSSFEVVVPNGRVRVGGTDRNWEGTGVVPDVPAPAADALRIAQVRAIRRLADTTTPGAWRDALLRRLDDLTKAF